MIETIVAIALGVAATTWISMAFMDMARTAGARKRMPFKRFQR